MWQLNEAQVIVLSLLFASTLWFIFINIRHKYRRRFTLTTEVRPLEPGKAYYFQYRHGILDRRDFMISIPEDDKKTYLLKEITYYNHELDIIISSIYEGIIVYSAELNNVLHKEILNIEEVE